MKQDIKAQTEDMKSEMKNEASSEYIRATYTGKPHARSSKYKICWFKNTKKPKWKDTRVTETPAQRLRNAKDVDMTNHMKPVQLLPSNITCVKN